MNAPVDSRRETLNFCTLFDSNFLAQGLCLAESLARHARPFRLWILCMDEAVEKELRALALPDVELIPLRELETDRLRAVKGGRSRGEYCWTLTPFLPGYILDKNPGIPQVTYVDADLFFYADPRHLLVELEKSGADVQITEHAYAPEYDQSATSGRFCVQFLTFRTTPRAREVMAWWQERCLEWCFARHEDGKFGDQKYLDQWPTLFGDRIQIVKQVARTLAPWNVAHFERLGGGHLSPVFYHFHGLRILHPRIVRLYEGYRIGSRGRRLYTEYIAELRKTFRRLHAAGIPVRALPGDLNFLKRAKLAVRCFTGQVKLLL